MISKLLFTLLSWQVSHEMNLTYLYYLCEYAFGWNTVHRLIVENYRLCCRVYNTDEFIQIIVVELTALSGESLVCSSLH